VKDPSTEYDAIIVGAGLSGLSAAYELKDRKVLIIEKNNYLGGRVLTKKKQGVAYELGAIFAYDPSQLPFQIEPSQLIREEGKIGVSFNGSVTLGEGVVPIVLNIPKRLENETVLIDGITRKPDLEDVIDALFQVIHPGDRNQYLEARKRDAFYTWPNDHYAGGNSEMIEAFRERISARIVLGAEVTSISQLGDAVAVEYTKDNVEVTKFSEAAVIATPATIARNILRTSSEESSRFLRAVRYGSGIVVTLCLEDIELLNFRYVVTPYQKTNTIFRSKSEKADHTVLTVYYLFVHDRHNLRNLTDRDLFTRTLAEINQVGIGTISEKDIVFFDVHSWTDLGTVIDEAYLKWNPNCARPSPRIFLAGDYMDWNEDQLPYGMAAAIMSGQERGKAVEAFLEGTGTETHL
jgi:monoamine oxidase